MLPLRSPFGLIQEDLWPDVWLILVSCMMLNCTSRKQVEKVLPVFVRMWPTAEAFLVVEALCRPLGFAVRRTKNLKTMTRAFLEGKWSSARELPGIGEYAGRAWEIFCLGELGSDEPKDGALKVYWRWRVHHEDKARTNCGSKDQVG